MPNQSEGGLADSHPAEAPFPILLAPTTGKERNTLRMDLIPVGCWKINDVRFDFGSSFVLPESRDEFHEFAALRQKHPGAPVSLFGHADPTGADEFNMPLSEQRAEAVYAVFLRDTGRWEKLYPNWGPAATARMHAALGTQPDPKQKRADLFLAYMNYLCPVKLEKTDFLGNGGKGDFQGCSEFNPVRVFSQAEQQNYSHPSQKPVRDADNGVNRRVVGLLFRPGTIVSPAKWPCGNGIAGCKKRFWSDGEARRSPQPERREFPQTLDTFACRFYHRLTVTSPCEGVVRKRVRVWIDDPFLGFIGGVELKVTYENGNFETILTNDEGYTMLYADQGEYADLQFWTELGEQRQRFFIVLEPAGSKNGAWQRLVNLGYVFELEPESSPPAGSAFAKAVAAFQARHGIKPSGELDGATASAIDSAHESERPYSEEGYPELPDDHFSNSANRRKDEIG
ncbi:MAG: hypothetical protein FJW30_28620 [Acidobacteria bacterium]|nr:hypothetical protein [Acidobacteriota bacterium]